jgi:hypothetical protein
VAKLAEALMHKSGVDDEAIQSGENLLLTFTNVQNQVGKGNDIFNQATSTMLDMSVALGQDTKSSAVQLGKALNDPIKGITALSRVGVSFTAGQKAQIKAMVDAGDTMGAQKIILAELNKEFGGSAEAAGKTLPGQISILKESFSNLAGELTATLVPALSAVAGFFAKHPALAKAMVIGVLAVAAAMVLLNVALAVTAALASPWILAAIGIAAAVAAVAAGLIYAYKHSETFRDIVDGAFSVVKTVASTLFNWFKSNWPLLLAIITGPVGAAAILLVKHWGSIRDATTGAWAAVKGAVSSAVDWMHGALSGLATWISGFANGVWKAAVGRVTSILDGIGTAAHDAVAAVKGAMHSVEKAISDAVAGIGRAASSVASAIKGPINAVINAWNGVAFTIPTINIPKIKIGKKTFGGGSVGGSTINFPNVPTLASGGVVDTATLALVGEGAGREIVAPEALLREIVGAGSGPQVRVFIGATELTHIVRTEVVDMNTGIARTLLAGGAPS